MSFFKKSRAHKRHIRFSADYFSVIAVCVALLYATIPNAVARGDIRSISLHNTHTKENLTITFKRDGQFDQDALLKINAFMRDWRVNKPIEMDPALIDLLWELHKELGSKKPIHLVSGYRSPKTNAMLRRIGRHVARHSMHMRGRATDVFFPDIPIKKLRESALLRERGGVGYYPRSGKYGFVHIDTGRVRHWPRMSPTRLAALFKKRKNNHRQISKTRRTQIASTSTGARNFSGVIKPASRNLKLIATPKRKPPMLLASLSQTTAKTKIYAASQLAAIPKPRNKPMLTARVKPVFVPVARRARPFITASIYPAPVTSYPRAKPVVPQIFATIQNAAKARRSTKGDLKVVLVASFANLDKSPTAAEQIAPGLIINRARKGNLLMSTHSEQAAKLPYVFWRKAHKPASTLRPTIVSSLN